MIEFKTLLQFLAYDMICLTETWLTEKIDTEELNNETYDIIRADRGTRGERTLIALKKKFSHNNYISQIT